MTESLITNAWYEVADKATLPVETVRLFEPAGPEDWYYSHHPFLTHFQERYYAMWSSGRENEDDVGQRVMISSSPDFRSWTEPVVLAPTVRGRFNEVTRYAEGWHQHAGTLVAYVAQFEYEADAVVDGHRTSGDRRHMDTTLCAMTSQDGDTWSAPLPTGLCMGPNHGPQRLASGRLVISTSFTYPYTDDPSGLTGWTMAGIYPPDMAEPIIDDSEWIWKMQALQGWPTVLCEGSFYQTDDGVIHMLLRSNSGRLWVTQSADDAETWSAPVPTSFTNNASKFHAGRLPDGRFYWVGNPETKPEHSRCPLALLLSDDGVRFGRHYILADATTLYVKRKAGMHKSGQYGYPHTLIHDGALCVIVSREKEAVDVLRIPLTALTGGA